MSLLIGYKKNVYLLFDEHMTPWLHTSQSFTGKAGYIISIYMYC